MPEITDPTRWYRPTDLLPQDGQKVYMLMLEGEQIEGVYHKRLWFFADMRVYVDYTPAYWRPRE